MKLTPKQRECRHSACQSQSFNLRWGGYVYVTNCMNCDRYWYSFVPSVEVRMAQRGVQTVNGDA